MLSGLRVVPRNEIISDLQQNDAQRIEERKGSQRCRRKRKDKSDEKEKSRKSSKHKKVHSSIEHDGSSGCSDKEFSAPQRRIQSIRKKKKGYSDLSSESESGESDGMQSHTSESDDGVRNHNKHHAIAARTAAGLEWMTKVPHATTKIVEPENDPATVPVEEKSQVNPKELNPYLKDGGDGYPSEEGGLKNMGSSSLSRPPVVGDGGLSWRLKALKRAKEQAEREGRKLDEVVEERWGSLAEMTSSVSARRAAHAHAHLHAIRDRKRTSNDGKLDGQEAECMHSAAGGKKSDQNADKAKDLETMSSNKRAYLKDVSVQDTRMKAPRVSKSLSWKGNRGGKGHHMRTEDVEIFQAAASALNTFKNDGSFSQMFIETHQSAVDKGNEPEQMGSPEDGKKQTERVDNLNVTSISNVAIEGMDANQLAAKAIQLQLRGKTYEANELLNQIRSSRQEEAEAKNIQGKKETRTMPHANQSLGPSMKSIMADHERRTRRDEGDAAMLEGILHNKQYNKSTSIEDEYDFGSGLESSIYRKTKKASKGAGQKETWQAVRDHKRIITQQERCQFCFVNPSRPKHLTISIANSCYLMLPPREPLVEGHCLIVPIQHEGSTRNVDDNVWDELRNYKKCLLRMFANHEKEVLFMETAINLAAQRRHCIVEAIPLPREVSKQAPLYFKKAIDEAEDEWSQHNSKKLIDTSTKGLRACIPKNFPYFHVEFGLHAGYVHVIDNEKDFKSQFGQDVIIGMLKLPEEEMHRRRRQQSFEQQKKTAAEFQKMWDPFDWTKMLD